MGNKKVISIMHLTKENKEALRSNRKNRKAAKLKEVIISNNKALAELEKNIAEAEAKAKEQERIVQFESKFNKLAAKLRG